MRRIILLISCIVIPCIVCTALSFSKDNKEYNAIDDCLSEPGLYAVYPTVRGTGYLKKSDEEIIISARYIILNKEKCKVYLNNCYGVPITHSIDEVTEDGLYLVGKDLSPGIYSIERISNDAAFYVYDATYLEDRPIIISMPKVAQLLKSQLVTLVEGTVINVKGLHLEREE